MVSNIMVADQESNNLTDHQLNKYQTNLLVSDAQSSLNKCDNESYGIKDVWARNMYQEFKLIRRLAIRYRFIAMDTEFPGVVARPIGEFRSPSDYQFQLLLCNVELLKIIQLGLTLFDENGETPPGITTWQFNFRFSLSEDMFAQDSIDLLTAAGIQFRKHEDEGIDPYEFAQLLISSGIVLNDNIKWLSFHSGYDFGYLLKILTEQPLPQDEAEFFELLRLYFPAIYDVKYLMKSCKNLKGGLQEVADKLKLKRVGPQHQAGSDSLLTGAAFFKMREMFFEDNIDDSKYCGHLYGLGTIYVNNTGVTSNSGTGTIATGAGNSTTATPVTTTVTTSSQISSSGINQTNTAAATSSTSSTTATTNSTSAGGTSSVSASATSATTVNTPSTTTSSTSNTNNTNGTTTTNTLNNGSNGATDSNQDENSTNNSNHFEPS